MFDFNKVIVGLLWLALCYLGYQGPILAAWLGWNEVNEVYFLVGSVGWMPISGSITNFRTKTTIFPVRCLNPSFLLLKSPFHRPNQQSTAQSALSERPQRAAHMLPGVWGCGTGVIREEQTLPGTSGTSGTSGDDRKKNLGNKMVDPAKWVERFLSTKHDYFQAPCEFEILDGVRIRTDWTSEWCNKLEHLLELSIQMWGVLITWQAFQDFEKFFCHIYGEIRWVHTCLRQWSSVQIKAKRHSHLISLLR